MLLFNSTLHIASLSLFVRELVKKGLILQNMEGTLILSFGYIHGQDFVLHFGRSKYEFALIPSNLFLYFKFFVWGVVGMDQQKYGGGGGVGRKST